MTRLLPSLSPWMTCLLLPLTASAAAHTRHPLAPQWTRPAAGAGPWSAEDPGKGTAVAATPSPADLAHASDAIRYPLDLTYYGGPVMAQVVNHSIYLTTPSCSTGDCYGQPDRFLGHLFRSDFRHVLDQYLGDAEEDASWKVAPARMMPLPSGLPTLPGGTNPVLLDSDIAALVTSVATASGEAGYQHLYQVFLPPNVDVCFDNTYSTCFSPDSSPSTAPSFSWFLCAYHSAVAFGPASAPQTAVYTVVPNMAYTPPAGEPVGYGCGVLPGSPNGNLIDSTANLVSRETFATVTNPGDPYATTTPGLAWFQRYPFFDEISDICAGSGFPNVLAFDSTGTLTAFYPAEEVNLAGATYAVQREYSNREHACVAGDNDRESQPRGAEANLYRHPSDLWNFGGPTVATADLHPLFLTTPTCTADDDCYGDPVTFLNHLTRSRFMHIAAEYVGTNPALTVVPPVRIPLPAGLTVLPGGTNPVLTDAQVQGLIANEALAEGNVGLGHVFHFFLPRDVDVCFDSTYSTCFSPDAPFLFGFCGYHGSFNATDAAGNVHPIQYTVQPNVDSQWAAGFPVFCEVLPGSPNGTHTDSMASALSHELFETLSDPIVVGAPTSWIAPLALAQEVGDLCNLNQVSSTGVAGHGKVVVNIDLAGKTYGIQSEYSNAHHACVIEP
jgi:hypothetical protein